MIVAGLLDESDVEGYERLLATSDESLVYSSLRYRTLLREYLGDESFYLIAKEGSDVVGALPLFLRLNDRYGNVLNSLPFYGSHGGVIVEPDFAAPEKVFRTLLKALDDLALEKSVLISTIITSPFERFNELYSLEMEWTFKDARIGQITPLGEEHGDVEDLMALLPSKTRNMVRKALKSGLTVEEGDDPSYLDFLYRVHAENMAILGGIAKGREFFSAVSRVFRYGMDYRVWVASLDGTPVSALLTLQHGKTVEYFTPAIVSAHRSLQPNSLLIFEAMRSAAAEGYQYWNFGGTRPSQEGLYRFKASWAARDFPYEYFVRVHSSIDHLLRLQPSELLDEYPLFYVLPFDVLSQ